MGGWGGPFDDLVILMVCTKLVKGGRLGWYVTGHRRGTHDIYVKGL